MQTAPTILPWSLRPATPPLNRVHIAIGLTVSLLLHLTLAAWSWQHKMASQRFTEKHTIAVQLLTPPHRVEPAPVLPPVEPTKPRNVVRSTPGTKPRPESRAVVTVQSQVPQDKAAPTVPASPTEPEKHLDMNAIYGSVKSAVAEVDRENAETPVGQLAAKPLYPPEGNKIGKMINGTTRPDCRDTVGGMGLFTPIAALATLLDKKDSGCKWR